MNEMPPNLSEEQLEQARRIAYLIYGYVNQKLTVAEHDELDEWVAASDENMKLFEDLTDEDHLDKLKKWMAKLDTQKAYKKFQQRIHGKNAMMRSSVRNLLLLAAAASVLWLAVTFLANRYKENAPSIQPRESQSMDIAPGGNKAILTLNDGTIINMDSLQNGQVDLKGNITLHKENASISYASRQKEAAPSTDYNTLATPRGGQYHLALADGSQVWLNAASSIRYPVSFPGKERRVSITGEVYFEVAKNPSMPFVVTANGISIEVLGTHFNVNAYTDEKTWTTTLLEGSVKISSGSNRLVLKPGQQAAIENSGGLILNEAIDTSDIVAWKNGLFSFHESTIENLMRQASRWYDVDVQYKAKITDHFNARINRDVPLSKLIHLLELTGRVHFEVNQKTVIVKP